MSSFYILVQPDGGLLKNWSM